MPAQTVIKFRRDTAANWATTNPTLAAGEVGLETDTGLVKYGNGTSAWTALTYPSNSNTTYLVRNNTGATISKGTLVAATGAEPSGRIDVAPFQVTGLQDSELRVMGIATANIASGVNGTVMSFGSLTGLDTRGTVASALAVGDETWAAGDMLFAHPTVNGKLTKVRPKHDLAIAFITVSHATTGQISIRIVPGNFHLEWMHDVEISSIATDDILQWNGTAWVNATPPVGPQGEPGPPGNNGVNGSDGVNGTDGVDGTDGADGADGADGQSVLFRGDYDSEITYNAGDIVKTPISGSGQDPYPLQPLYVSLIDSNLDNTPGSSPSAWGFLVNDVLQAALDAKLSATITSPVTGQTIQYNGSSWVNAAAAETGFSGFLLMGA
jgi:hypothetical protein